jgi:hypothetical protein
MAALLLLEVLQALLRPLRVLLHVLRLVLLQLLAAGMLAGHCKQAVETATLHGILVAWKDDG